MMFAPKMWHSINLKDERWKKLKVPALKYALKE